MGTLAKEGLEAEREGGFVMVQRRTPALPSKRRMPASSAASLISFSALLLGLTLTAPRVLLAGSSPWGGGSGKDSLLEPGIV